MVAIKHPECIIKKHELIGRGSFGEVYRGEDTRSQKTVAIKVVNLETDHADIDEIRTEVSMLCNCDSPYIIKYHESFLVGSELWIVMDFCGLGSSRQLIDVVGPIQEETLPFVAKEILKALSYLHDNRIIHRDAKAANILVTDDGHLKLGDFGVASPMLSKARRGTIAGSPYWMAPEVMLNKKYDAKADIWSFGIAMYELLTGNPPYHNLEAIKVVELTSRATNHAPRLTGKFSKETTNFVNQCLIVDPVLRPSALELLKSKYFRGVKTHVAKSPLMSIAKAYKKAKEQHTNKHESIQNSVLGVGKESQRSLWDFSPLP